MNRLGLVSLKVYQAFWWMGLYNHVSPKRHIAWSNAPTVQRLDLGKMVKAKMSQSKSRTARSYYNKKGVKKFVGTKLLKHSQTFGLDMI